MTEQEPGFKLDEAKPRWDLLPWRSVKEIVRVLTWALTKPHTGEKPYPPHNWQKVDGARDRYFAAAMRHLIDWSEGERCDPVSGIHHLAHAGCCILFLLWFELADAYDRRPGTQL